ncbi:hypothetical protein [Microbacterium sp. AR7-10]|uniref:hypothetical protein n=1 Tax=Microbacterium sp. AR7-10 TaxID=1891970 RepID=UPI003527FB9B
MDMVRLLMQHQADPGITDFAGTFPRDGAGERTRHLSQMIEAPSRLGPECSDL